MLLPRFRKEIPRMADRLGGSRSAGQPGRRRPAKHASESGHGILVRTCTLPPSRAAHPGRITPWARRPGRWYKRGVEQLKATVRAEGSYTLVTLAGESDANTRQPLRDFLESEVPQDVRRLIIDLPGLRFMDSAGVHVLVDVRAMLLGRGGELLLVAPQPVVARVMNLAGADRLIPVHADLDAALASAGS
jgi:anti-anti-sigma factor